MKRLAMSLLLALLSVSMAIPACSFFEKHVDPVIKPIVICSGETIPLSLVKQVYDDAMAENWIDLASNVVPLLKDGYADLECIFNYLGQSNPETAPHIKAMKAKHANEFKGSVSLRSPGETAPKTGPTVDKIPQASSEASTFRPGGEVPGGLGKYSYAGENPGAALAHCYRDCGDNAHGALAPPGGCECWRKVGSTWRWVALGDSSSLAGSLASR